LIPADGFYEWERTGKIAQPYFFQMRDESTFAFAGIWDVWQVGQQSITSCAIITTTANELLATIHDRMPVILPHEEYDTWLGADVEGARDLLTSFPASEMTSHAVSYDVNHPRIDEKYLITPVEPNLGVTLSLF
jgi:putative SOS response-associated peptidase YedK